MLQTLTDELFYYMDSGGFIMWPLVIGSFALWYALGYRFIILKRGSTRGLRKLVSDYRNRSTRKPKGVIDSAVVMGLEISRRCTGNIAPFLDDEFSSLLSYVSRFRILARVIVLLAPLAGLLGTVSGMIEMFDSLGSQTFYSQSGGVARGIGQALFTTQLGLAIAVPGMIVSRILERRQGRIEEELSQLKNILCTGTGENQ